jgi:UDP-N-acetylmuramoylalanine--D-glutamate ligase
MQKEDLIRGKRVTVFGLGLNGGGVGTVRFLAEAGAREIVVTDAKMAEQLAPSIEVLRDIPNIRYVFGESQREDFTETDLVIKNPGIPWTNPCIVAAQGAGVPVEVDASLFFQFCRGKIIGVTGTKGKTTTATLLAFLLRAAGKKVVEVGIGQTPVLSVLKDINEETLVVFELSSWRLSGLRHHRVSPSIAVFTNFFPDHLNYYASMDEYFEDKRMICAFQKPGDHFVYPSQDPHFSEACGEGDQVGFSLHDTGAHLLVFWRMHTIVYRDEIGQEQMIFDGSQLILLRGEHNRSNILAAVAATLMAGVAVVQLQHALPKFTGVPHRLEFVREWRGVKFYNDTTATVPEAAVNALESFSEPLILIAGGADKNLDLAILARAIVEHMPKAIVLFRGQATEKLLEALQKQSFAVDHIAIVDSMQEALAKAQERAEAGDVVLLSPGAASFGIFQNEFDRGDQFRELVNTLSL